MYLDGRGETTLTVITPPELTVFILRALPDAEVQISDRTGTLDHYNMRVISRGFAGLSPLDQHRLVYRALDEPLRDGRLHAVELKTEMPA